MTGQAGYDELRLRIVRGPLGDYRTEATASDGSRAEASFVRPFTDVDLDEFVRKVDPTRVRGTWTAPVEEAKRFGTALAAALLVGDVRDVYGSAKARADANGRGLRLALGLTSVPELMEIPWEFLYERPGFIAASRWTPLVRTLDLKDVRSPWLIDGPLRMLGVVSQPRGVGLLDTDAERGRVERALRALIDTRAVELEWLVPPTLGALELRMAREGSEIHVLHFIGHGQYDEPREGGVLMFEDSQGRRRDVTGEELCGVIRDERSLQLAVLNACEGARASHVDPFSGVASALVECGLPAVVGMQFSITDAAATLFAERFYTLLTEGHAIDAAVARTRAALLANEHEVEFGTPVLFLRGTSTRLFDPVVRRRPDDIPAEQPVTPDVERVADPLGSQSDDSTIIRSGEQRRRASEPYWQVDMVKRSWRRFMVRFHSPHRTLTVNVSVFLLRPPAVAANQRHIGYFVGYEPIRFELFDGGDILVAEVFQAAPRWFGVGKITLRIDGQLVVLDDQPMS